MKTIFKFTAVAALMFATTVSRAHEPKMKLVNGNDIKGLIFELDSQSRETAIKLKDAEDHVIFSENISTGVYAKKFDLKKLKDGMYYFSTENTLKSVIYTISIDKAAIHILGKKERSKPVFRKDKNMVYLNLLNLDRGNVAIKVFDSSNRVLFKEVIEGKVSVEKAFNFKKAFSDSYTVVVKDNENTYYETIKIN